MWGRRSWWEMPVEESQAAMKARRYCWVTCMGWSHHHTLSLPTHQGQQLNNREAAPPNAWCTELQSRTPVREPLYVTDVPNNREGPQARGPSKCLDGQSYRERLDKEAFYSPATRDLKIDSDRAITPAVEAVCVPEHLAPLGTLQVKQLHCLHAQFSLGQSCDSKKKSLVFMRAGLLWSCPTLCNPVDDPHIDMEVKP